jgi:hypothetical protein
LHFFAFCNQCVFGFVDFFGDCVGPVGVCVDGFPFSRGFFSDFPRRVVCRRRFQGIKGRFLRCYRRRLFRAGYFRLFCAAWLPGVSRIIHFRRRGGGRVETWAAEPPLKFTPKPIFLHFLSGKNNRQIQSRAPRAL